MDRRTKRAGLGTTLLVLLVVLLGGYLGPLAPAAQAESRLDVSAGYGGFHVPGRSLPVQVTVTAERLVKGELVVLGTGSSPCAGSCGTRASVPVEVAGGSVKRFTLVVPGGVTASAASVDVELRVGGRALGRGKADVKAVDEAELVGLGPQLVEESLPGPAPLAVDTGVARFFALDAGLLAQAPDIARSRSRPSASAAGELAGLAPGVRAGLLRWVGSGGHLLLDEAAGTTIDGLPAEWQPGPAGRVAAGVGEVRLTGDAMSAGRWAGLIEPSSVGRTGDANGFFSPESVADSLARDAGLRLPGLPWLLGFLGLYIVVVGPVTGFVLRWRRRPDLTWVVVPALAVAFTVLAYGAGNQLRPGAGLAHGTVLETRASGPVATSWVALTRRSAGTAHVALPAGWAIKGSVSDNGNGFGPATPVLTVGDSGPEAQLPLASGEFGVFKAAGPAPVTGRLEVTASSAADGRAEGTVRNGLPFALDEVVVFVDGAPGPGRRAWRPASRSHGRPSAPRSSTPAGPKPGCRRRASGRTGWSTSRSGSRPRTTSARTATTTGTALAVGWTREWEPEFTVDGKGRHAPGRTAVVGRAPVAATDGRITDVTVGADVVRGPSLNPFRGNWIGNNAGRGVGGEDDPAAGAGGPAPDGPRRRCRCRTSPVWQRRRLAPPRTRPSGATTCSAMLRFKRGFAVKGGRLCSSKSPPAPASMTTATFPAFPAAAGPGAAHDRHHRSSADGRRPPRRCRSRLPQRCGRGRQAAVDIALPDGIGADGVVFLRLVADASMGIPGDAVLSLVEVVK